MWFKKDQPATDVDSLRVTLKNKERDLADLRAQWEREMKMIDAKHQIEVNRLNAEKQNAVLEAKNEALKEVTETKKENAVLKAEAVLQAKMVDLNATTIEAAMRIIAGTARSMGLEILH